MTAHSPQNSSSRRKESYSSSASTKHGGDGTSPLMASRSASPRTIKSPQLPPRSPNQDPRERAGTSRTRYYAPREDNGLSSPPGPLHSRKGSISTPSAPTPTLIELDDSTDPSASSNKSVGMFTVGPAASEAPLSELDNPSAASAAGVPTAEVDMDVPHAPYRSPEAVIEDDGPPPDYRIAEDSVSDDGMPGTETAWNEKANYDISSWQQSSHAYDVMDIDPTLPDGPEKPRIGPGILPRRFLQLVHEHELLQPIIESLPKPSERRSHASSSSIAEPPKSPILDAGASATSLGSMMTQSQPLNQSEPYHAATLDDVWKACPGGLEQRGEWFFCVNCWAWLRITGGTGPAPIQSMSEWELSTEGVTDELRAARQKEMSRYNNVLQFRQMRTGPEYHFLHKFEALVTPTRVSRIERIHADDEWNAFPHISFGFEEDEGWSKYGSPTKRPAALYVDSGTDMWVQVDEGMVPGQIAPKLYHDFKAEKHSNPNVGFNGAESVNQALSLLVTLLQNPLFKRQRGWVQLENNKFRTTIGSSLASSNLLCQIGFGCRQEPDALRVGPFMPNDKITKEDVAIMDQYMLRTWVELSIALAQFQQRSDLDATQEQFVMTQALHDVLDQPLHLDRYPKRTVPVSDQYIRSLHTLGVTKQDIAETIINAYELQVEADPACAKAYFSALFKLQEVSLTGRELIQTKVAVEQSLDRYTDEDLADAYRLIGYEADAIGIEPENAPDDFIFKLHKEAQNAATTSDERRLVNKALLVIGKERENALMIRLGKEGQSFVSVEDAYAALGAPREATDEGLLMQYELAVADFPGKADHYKMCLGIIASAQGEERPGLQNFIQTGSRAPEAPPRKDIPVGLHNIGNTCYLNSILQYLYSIKPLRDAVMSFEQGSSGSKTPLKPEIERSRRFVRQLRLLFLQLYKCEGSSVRPEEELAYLAITRPEVDQIVEPEATAAPAATSGGILDSIPTIPSETSTRVNSPTLSPTLPSTSLPSSPRPSRPEVERSSSILGKRASEDRDDSSRSSLERTRPKNDGFEDLGEVPSVGTNDDDEYEMIAKDRKNSDRVDSPSAATDLGALKLKSPELEEPPSTATAVFPDDETRVDADVDMASVPPPLPPRPAAPIRKDTLASGLKFGLQQDSAEVLINVLTQLEMAFDPAAAEGESSGPNLISELFSCKYHQQTFYESSAGIVEAQTPVESVFVHPIIGVEEEGKDLYDCLAELYLKGAEIEYEGKKGYMMDLMDSFPPMLYIQMRRSQYDFRTGRESKTNTHIAFDQVLCMDRFLASADKAKREESVEITREMTRVRARLHQLKNNKPMSIPGTFLHAREALANLAADESMGISGITPDLLAALDNEAEEVKKEIESLEGKLPELKRRLDGIWQGERQYEYELVSVFMHRGKTSGAGHYWTYQAHLPDRPDEFFKYNDETVTAVPASEVLEDRTGSDANPALLCYVRKDRNLVDTLHREILEVEALLGDEVLDETAEPVEVTVRPAEQIENVAQVDGGPRVGNAEHVEHVEHVEHKTEPMEVVEELEHKAA